MRKFEEFLKSGTVIRQSPNLNRAIFLIEESEDKKKFFDVVMKSIPNDQMNSNFIANYCYDIILELVRAKMFIDGFNSGVSLEAEVSYFRVLGFSEAETEFLDELRYFRNGTKYYGTILDKNYAQKVLNFFNKAYPKLKELLGKK